METIYKKAKPDDFLSIAALDRRAWLSNRYSEFIPDGEHAWRIWVEHALVYIAEENGTVIGAILAFPCVSGPWCVHKVFVAHEKRGLGIGTQLFDVLLNDLDRLGTPSFLTVDPVNERALNLYEKWGFTDRTFVKGYYRPHEDRFVLTRKPSGNAAGG